MRLRLALALLAVVLLAGCSVTRGSGQLSSEPRQVNGFSKVELTGAGELSIEQTGTESLTISAEENLLPMLTSDVSGDTLVLGTQTNAKIVPTKPITYTLTVKDLNGLAVSGSGNVTVTKLATTAFNTSISGSGTITINGTAVDQNLEITGSGRYQAEELASESAKINISGSGVASVRVTDELDVHISGSGTLTYTGDPKDVTQEISGSGKLIKG
jgi:hypothetical protein